MSNQMDWTFGQVKARFSPTVGSNEHTNRHNGSGYKDDEAGGLPIPRVGEISDGMKAKVR